MVASHAALNGGVDDTMRDLECVGGLLLEDAPEALLSPSCLDETLDRLDDAPDYKRESAYEASGQAALVPDPLARYVGQAFEAVAWRRVLPSLRDFHLGPLSDGSHASLLRIRAGGAMPAHTHEGIELTLVLQGAFRDETGLYRVGDLSVGDAQLEHRPVAEPGEDCICLVAQDAPCRFTGVVGRLLNGIGRV